MDTLLIATIISAVGNIGLGVYALVKDPKSQTNRFFASFSIIVALWVVELFWSLEVNSLWLVRGSIFLAVFLETALYLFAHSFVFEVVSRRLKLMLALVCFGAASLTLSPFVFPSRVFIDGVFMPTVGPGMAIFSPFVILLIIGVWVVFTYGSLKGEGRKRMQSAYMLVGLLLTMGAILCANLFGVVILHTSKYLPIGIMSTLIFTGVSVFVMTRYRFLEARVKLTRNVAYWGLIILLLVVGVSMLWGFKQAGAASPLVMLTLVTALIDLGLAGYLLSRRPLEKQRLLVGLVLLQMGLWAGVHFFGGLTQDASQLVWLARTSFLVVLFVPVCFLLFSAYFSHSLRKRQAYFLFLPPLLMLPFAFSKYNADGFLGGVAGYDNVLTGALYNFYIPYFLLYCGAALVMLVLRQFRLQPSIERTRIRIIIAVFVATALFGILNNAIFPVLLDIHTSPSYGVAASLIFSVGLTYAMTRYRFFGVRFIVTRGLSYGGVVLVVLVAAGLAMWRISATVGFNEASVILLVVVILLLLGMGFQHVHRQLRRQIRKLVPVQGYDFSKVEQAPEVLDTAQYFTKMLGDVRDSVAEGVPGSSAEMYVYLRPEDRWLAIDNDAYPRLFSDHPLAAIPTALEGPVGVGELVDSEWLVEHGVDEAEAKRAHKLMKDFSADVIVPVWWYGEEVRGIVMVSIPGAEKGVSKETIDLLGKQGRGFGGWLSDVIAYHYAMRRAERMAVGLDIERKD